MAISKIPNTGRRLSDAFAAIAIPENAGKAPQAVSAGQYVIWNGALHTATRDISSGETLSLSSLAPVSGGGLNALNSRIAVLPFVSNAALGNNNAGFHNSIYRGKNLGSALTAEQSAAIQAGTFDDLFIGDYWVINGHTHTIADFDPYLRVGDSETPGHHVGVISNGEWSSEWYESNDTSRGYVSLDAGTIRKYIKDTVEPEIIADFGSSHVQAYRALFPSAYSNGAATAFAWADAKSELLCETEVFGHQVCTANGAGNSYEDGHGQRQLSIFRLKSDFMYTRAHWWLRSVASATSACFVFRYGYAANGTTSTARPVRPLSLIR